MELDSRKTRIWLTELSVIPSPVSFGAPLHPGKLDPDFIYG